MKHLKPSLIGATFGLVFAASSTLAQNDQIDAARRSALTKLLAEPSVTLVRVHRVFVPGKNGKAPVLRDASRAWVAYRAGRMVGVYDLPSKPVKVPSNEIKARLIDVAKDHPDSWAVPGLCDADSRWFRDAADLADGSANASVKAATALETWQKGWRRLVVESGVTTVFVPASTTAQSSGPGSLVGLGLSGRPRPLVRDGAQFFRVASLATRGTTLTFGSAAKALRAAFKGAKKGREAAKKWKKDLAEYRKKRKEFLAYYKKNPMKPGDKNERTARRRPSGARRGGRIRLSMEDMMRIRRLPPEKRREELEKLRKAAQAKAAPKTAQKTPPKKPDAKTKGKKAPPRPKYPKRPKQNPALDSVLRILDGKSTLRIEAHRKPEILAVLDVVKEFHLPRVVIVGGTEAYRVAKELRSAGASVVLSPQKLPGRGIATLPEHLAASAAKLAAAGVPVAFGSGGRERGRLLPLLAARAVAHGMTAAQALQALTENAWVAAGSKGARGLVVYDGDPLAPATKVLMVGTGKTLESVGGTK